VLCRTDGERRRDPSPDNITKRDKGEGEEKGGHRGLTRLDVLNTKGGSQEWAEAAHRKERNGSTRGTIVAFLFPGEGKGKGV